MDPSPENNRAALYPSPMEIRGSEEVRGFCIKCGENEVIKSIKSMQINPFTPTVNKGDMKHSSNF